ncbi:cytochrome b/b6 domain-containing protein [Parasedimentitalea psychrophila]|uniref:Cytochrome b/b6 domain-containing protein n=1 Tax=Parasedimentitalea psychrophila TaxID=2997337 RepID=A0A9Y2KZ56_9RHOB|nr:cytochrome b/b6 domain-containing protein [Parasedimentitalea psychrophila]WIY24552.1 cytochrome b/b6 domain-containing protein [Parasedimentitalea psychrophila]
MSRYNSRSRYGSVAKGFHWVMALLILTAIPLGLIANDLAQHIRSPEFDGSLAVISRVFLLFSLHKTIGVAIFFTALLRILWAISQPKPGLLHPDRRLESWAAETVHWLLYGSLVLVPLCGWIEHAATSGFAPIWWPFGQDLPLVPKSESVAHLFASMHVLFVRVLIVSLLLHIAGAVKHHVIDRDATLHRMLPGKVELPPVPDHSSSHLPLVTALAVWAAVLGTGVLLGFFTSADQTVTQAAPAQSAPLQQVASGWTVQNGTLGISITQMGSQVSGSFTDWTAAINFDAAAPIGAVGDVEVNIAVGSFALGTVTAQAMGPDYFDNASYPTAVFKAQLEKLELDYQAVGTLTIRDQVVPLTLPFTLELHGDHAEMSGSVTLDRLDFDIGQGLPDEASLGFAVEVEINLNADRVN